VTGIFVNRSRYIQSGAFKLDNMPSKSFVEVISHNALLGTS
jgi:hypothetical protein